MTHVHSSQFKIFILTHTRTTTPTSMEDADADELPCRLQRAPALFRTALKAAKAGSCSTSALDELRRTAQLEAAARQTCSTEELCACKVLAADVAAMGGERAASTEHLRTRADAACFIAQIRQWIGARERLESAQEQTAPTDYCRSGYLDFDGAVYNFRSLAIRMLRAEGMLEGLPSDCEDPLGSLHLSDVGTRELGYLSSAGALGGASTEDNRNDAQDQKQELEYSRALDDATRYGCGSFNRAWKSSSLRADFLALYERFVAEVIAPALGASEGGGLVYQALPILRVFLPHHLGVGPRHTDAAYHCQPNELNIWLPLTEAYGTNSLFVESRPGAGDFEPICCDYGTFFHFRGNACEHFTELNVSGRTRVSIDFRVIRPQEVPRQPVPVAPSSTEGAADKCEHAGRAQLPKGAAEYFSIGRYYKRLPDRVAEALLS